MERLMKRCLCLLFILFPFFGAAIDLLKLKEEVGIYDLRLYSSVFDEKSEIKDINYFLKKPFKYNFKAYDESLLNEDKNIHWLSIHIDNSNAKENIWFFCFGNSSDAVTLYEIKDAKVNTEKITGLDFPIKSKEVQTGRAEFIRCQMNERGQHNFLIKFENKRKFSKQLFKYSLESFKTP